MKLRYLEQQEVDELTDDEFTNLPARSIFSFTEMFEDITEWHSTFIGVPIFDIHLNENKEEIDPKWCAEFSIINTVGRLYYA